MSLSAGNPINLKPMNCKIHHIIISPDHNFVGHFGGPAGTNPAIPKQQVNLVAGKGIEEDRYYRMEEGHRKQITFFDVSTLEMLGEHFGKPVTPDLVRRNVFVSGVDLPSLVGKRFTIGGIEFIGMDPCPPCQWMDASVGDGARNLMEGKGGLRAKILTSGILAVGSAELEILEEVAVE